LGTRLTVRCHHPEVGFADSIGHLVSANAQQLVLDTRHGRRTIDAATIAIVHVIEQRPPRRPD